MASLISMTSIAIIESSSPLRLNNLRIAVACSSFSCKRSHLGAVFGQYVYGCIRDVILTFWHKEEHNAHQQGNERLECHRKSPGHVSGVNIHAIVEPIRQKLRQRQHSLFVTRLLSAHRTDNQETQRRANQETSQVTRHQF
jgi:hypothetical protein